MKQAAVVMKISPGETDVKAKMGKQNDNQHPGLRRQAEGCRRRSWSVRACPPENGRMQPVYRAAAAGKAAPGASVLTPGQGFRQRKGGARDWADAHTASRRGAWRKAKERRASCTDNGGDSATGGSDQPGAWVAIINRNRPRPYRCRLNPSPGASLALPRATVASAIRLPMMHPH